jgi:hypothetical protein
MKKVVLLFASFFVVVAFSQKTRTIIFQQGFENVEYFSKLSPAGYTSSQNPENGYWGVFKDDKAVCLSDDQAAMGSYSLKVTRMATSQTIAVCMFSPALALSGVSTFEVWVYRPSKSEFSMYLMGLDKNQESSKRVDIAVLNTGERGKLFIRNNAETQALRTNVPMPADIWVLLSVEINRKTNTVTYSYESDGKKTIIGELDFIGNSIEIDRIMFGATPCPAGSPTYFDDIKVFHSN